MRVMEMEYIWYSVYRFYRFESCHAYIPEWRNGRRTALRMQRPEMAIRVQVSSQVFRNGAIGRRNCFKNSLLWVRIPFPKLGNKKTKETKETKGKKYERINKYDSNFMQISSD